MRRVDVRQINVATKTATTKTATTKTATTKTATTEKKYEESRAVDKTGYRGIKVCVIIIPVPFKGILVTDLIKN